MIGGTQFVGRAFVEEAASRGHEPTLFHRGDTEPGDLPDVEHLHGDRNGGLDVLRGRTWDAALDTCAYVPRAVRELAAVIESSVEHYTVVSTISVYPSDTPAGATEKTPVRPPPYPDTEEVTGETYGGLKVLCEVEALDAFGARCMIIRPGYIVGPHDPTDRFTYYVRRAASGGEMLAPGPPDTPFQFVDVRDLAAFMLGRIVRKDVDTYGVAGPATVTMRDALATAIDIGRAGTRVVWASESFLSELGEERWQLFPMWHPEFAGLHAFDASKARGSGLGYRPLTETISDTLAWDADRGKPPLKAGLTEAKERELLTRWRERSR